MSNGEKRVRRPNRCGELMKAAEESLIRQQAFEMNQTLKNEFELSKALKRLRNALERMK